MPNNKQYPTEELKTVLDAQHASELLKAGRSAWFHSRGIGYVIDDIGVVPYEAMRSLLKVNFAHFDSFGIVTSYSPAQYEADKEQRIREAAESTTARLSRWADTVRGKDGQELFDALAAIAKESMSLGSLSD